MAVCKHVYTHAHSTPTYTHTQPYRQTQPRVHLDTHIKRMHIHIPTLPTRTLLHYMTHTYTCHLDTRSLELMAKNVESASVATAFAKNDLPVPGGPYNKIPNKEMINKLSRIRKNILSQ